MTPAGGGLRRGRRGFSVIELMLALAILGVLMGALVPAVRGWHEGGKFTATLKTAAALTGAVRQYRLATGSWPASWADLSGRYLATASPTTPWGGSFTLTSTARYAEITTTVPLGSPPSGILPPMASLSAVAGGTQLTVRVPVPGEPADLEFERHRLTGS